MKDILLVLMEALVHQKKGLVLILVKWNKIFYSYHNSIISSSDYTKCISLSNQKFMFQPTLIKLHRNEYSQELRYYPFADNLDRCAGKGNTPDAYLIKYMM